MVLGNACFVANGLLFCGVGFVTGIRRPLAKGMGDGGEAVIRNEYGSAVVGWMVRCLWHASWSLEEDCVIGEAFRRGLDCIE